MMGPCGKCPDCTVFKDPTYCPNLEGCGMFLNSHRFSSDCTNILFAQLFAVLSDLHIHRMAGITKDGGFAEYCLLDARTAAKLPDEMAFEQAAPLMCAGVTIYSAIKKAEACGLKEGGVSDVHY